MSMEDRVPLRNYKASSSTVANDPRRGRLVAGDAKQFGYEESLPSRIMCGQPSYPSFPNHVDGFDTLQCSPRALKRTITLGEPGSFLHISMVLLDHVIQILALSELNATRQTQAGRRPSSSSEGDSSA